MSSTPVIITTYNLDETDINELKKDKDAIKLFEAVPITLESVKEAFDDPIALQKLKYATYKTKVRDDEKINKFIKKCDAEYAEWFSQKYPLLLNNLNEQGTNSSLINKIYTLPSRILQFARETEKDAPEVYKDKIIHNYVEFEPVYESKGGGKAQRKEIPKTKTPRQKITQTSQTLTLSGPNR